jgi:hypothetical protein
MEVWKTKEMRSYEQSEDIFATVSSQTRMIVCKRGDFMAKEARICQQQNENLLLIRGEGDIVRTKDIGINRNIQQKRVQFNERYLTVEW